MAEVSFDSWACGVTAAQDPVKVRVRVRVPPGVHLPSGRLSLRDKWRVRRTGCDPPQSNLIFGGIVSIMVVTLTGYRFIGSRERPRDFPGPFAFLRPGKGQGLFRRSRSCKNRESAGRYWCQPEWSSRSAKISWSFCWKRCHFVVGGAGAVRLVSVSVSAFTSGAGAAPAAICCLLEIIFISFVACAYRWTSNVWQEEVSVLNRHLILRCL
jgi:hypothetical protein